MYPNSDEFARVLRKRPTEAENTLWKHLRAKRLKGLKFRRQARIGKYIVDFVCYEKKFIIELDGGQHACHEEKDNERDEWLRSQGFKILKFWNSDVLRKTEEMLEIMYEKVSRITLPFIPSHQGRGTEGCCTTCRFTNIERHNPGGGESRCSCREAVSLKAREPLE